MSAISAPLSNATKIKVSCYQANQSNKLTSPIPNPREYKQASKQKQKPKNWIAMLNLNEADNSDDNAEEISMRK